MPYAGLTADDPFLARAREMCRRFCLEVWDTESISKPQAKSMPS